MDEIAAVSADIRIIYQDLDYDHRPFLPPVDTSLEIKKTEEFRIGYACFKHAVAKVLQPRRICEIGVGSGISARAFLTALPIERVKYLGIDLGKDEKEIGYSLSKHVQGLLYDLTKHISSFGSDKIGFWFETDSQKLTTILGPWDLVHVDASHEYADACHDLELAYNSGAKWILVDDCRDTTVAAAVMSTLAKLQPGSIEWAYFEDTWTGNILINRERSRA